MPGKNDIDPLSITDGKISNLANINPKKLAKATEGQILVAQSDGRFAAKSLTGDITLEASGATSVTSTTTTTDGETTVVTGPAGPTGEQGQVGAQGAQGPAGSDATVTTSAVDSAGAVMETDLVQTSAGAGDASKPIKLDSTGKIDASMIDDGDISYNNIADVPASFTPSAHKSTHATGGTDAIAPSDIGAEPAFTKNTAHNKNFGTAEGTVCEGDDSRLSDARTPVSHNHTLSDITDAGTAAAAATGDFAAHDHNHDAAYLGITAKAADSDKLDGNDSSAFAAASHNHTLSQITDAGTAAASATTDFAAASHNHDHNALTNYDVTEHRVIDDTNTDSQEKLWSAYNITTQLGTKSDTSHTHSAATTSADGFLSSTDKIKLDGVETGAEVNVQSDWNASSGDAQILNKPNVQYTSAIATGNNGLVPAAGTAGQFLAHDGTFATPPDTNTQLSTEDVQDIVGAMFTGNTETNITATYQDGDGTIDLVASSGSGSGTVNSGTIEEMAFYAATGDAVSGTSAFTFENTTDEEFNIGNGTTKGELGIACGVGSTDTTYRLFVNGHVKAGGLFDKSSTDYYLKPAGDSDYIAAKIGGSLFCYDVNTDVSAPTGYAGIYAKTVSSNVRLFASDGVSTTQISPHDDKGNWIHHNYNFAEKKRTIVNMTELVKAVEELAGRSFTTEELDEE